MAEIEVVVIASAIFGEVEGRVSLPFSIFSLVLFV